MQDREFGVTDRDRRAALDRFIRAERAEAERKARCQALRKTIIGNVAVFLGLLIAFIQAAPVWQPWISAAFQWVRAR